MPFISIFYVYVVCRSKSLRGLMLYVMFHIYMYDVKISILLRIEIQILAFTG